MGLLKSVNNVPGIDYVEFRDNQYYNKYTYRARAVIPGIRYTWFAKTGDELRKMAKTGKNVRPEDRKELADNAELLSNYVDYRNQVRKNKTATVRVEHKTVAIFSNNLAELKQLEILDPNSPLEVDYTEVHIGSHIGVKYFVNEPKHKFRIYLKSRRAEDSFKEKISELLVKNTGVLFPSGAFDTWLNTKRTSSYYWMGTYLSSSYFIDYDDESMLSYIMLMYGKNFGKRYKLEKRPDSI